LITKPKGGSAMKKIIVAVLCSVFFLACSSAVFAKTEYPVKEISGVVKDVKVDTSNSYTTIEFDDGRLITFKGVYGGQVFSKNKHCSFKYQYLDVMFSQGTYIIDFKCQK
jgi:hypothetical protein